MNIFVHLHIFCSIWNIFCSWFPANPLDFVYTHRAGWNGQISRVWLPWKILVYAVLFWFKKGSEITLCNHNNNNKASFRTFEHSSRSKSQYLLAANYLMPFSFPHYWCLLLCLLFSPLTRVTSLHQLTYWRIAAGKRVSLIVITTLSHKQYHTRLATLIHRLD